MFRMLVSACLSRLIALSAFVLLVPSVPTASENPTFRRLSCVIRCFTVRPPPSRKGG